MGSPKEVLEPLKLLIEEGTKRGFELVAVVSQPARPRGRKRLLTDPPVSEFAKKQGLTVFQPEKASDAGFIEQLKALKPAVIITAAYGQMLSEDFLAVPTRATINIHPSLLPEYRGATPVQSALLDGKQKSGVSVLFTVKKMDAGAIIRVKESDIEPTEKAEELLNRLFRLGGVLCLEALGDLKDPEFTGQAQDEGKVTFCRKFSKTDGQLNFSESAETLYNRFRAFYPWPGTYTFCNGDRVVLEEMDPPSMLNKNGELGSFSLNAGTLQVVCKQGQLNVLKLKPANGKTNDARQFFEKITSKNISTLFTESD